MTEYADVLAMFAQWHQIMQQYEIQIYQAVKLPAGRRALAQTPDTRFRIGRYR